jgi:hypothetical protein
LAVGATTVGSAASADVAEVEGQGITWGTGSVAAVAMDSPLDQVVYGNQTVTAATYEFTATSDSYTMSKFAVQVASGAQAAIDSVWLYDGDTLLNPTGTGTPMDGQYATTTGMSLLIPANTSKTVTVKLKLNSVGTGAATPGLNASTTMVSALLANSSGTPEYENPTVANGEGNAVYVFKSYPTLTSTHAGAITITNDVSQSVYKFTIAPSAGGQLALKQFVLVPTWQDTTNLGDLELEYFKVYKNGVDVTSAMTIVDATGAAVTAGSGLTEVDLTGVYFSWNSEDIVTATTEYNIKATPKNFDKGSTSTDYVTLTLSSDASHTANMYLENRDGTEVWKLAAGNTGAAGVAANLIWSDRCLVGHSYTSGSSTADWYNGYLIKNLPLDSATLKP